MKELILCNANRIKHGGWIKYLLILSLIFPVFSHAGYIRDKKCKEFENRALTLINKQSIQLELLKKRLLKIEPELVTKKKPSNRTNSQ